MKSFGWYDDTEAIYIALEYCPHGDLHRYLSRRTPLPLGEAQELTRQILEGLHDMHVNGFAHRDLKPAVSGFHSALLIRYQLIDDLTLEHPHQIPAAGGLVDKAYRFWHQ